MLGRSTRIRELKLACVQSDSGAACFFFIPEFQDEIGLNVLSIGVGFYRIQKVSAIQTSLHGITMV